MVSTHSRLKAAEIARHSGVLRITVSTHSRLKAAEKQVLVMDAAK